MQKLFLGAELNKFIKRAEEEVTKNYEIFDWINNLDVLSPLLHAKRVILVVTMQQCEEYFERAGYDGSPKIIYRLYQ